MSQTSDNNKRIAKNTLLLYFRMLFMMVVSLYTSRVILNALGVEDFGIYNVVGGFVTMFSFLNTAMSAATQRFITFSLGKGNKENLKKVFSNCVIAHLIICIIVLVLAETIGLWFLYHKMIIPESRMSIAFWVYQCSVISTLILIMSVPYNADIIAHEKMSAFAYISIAEVSLKLLIVFLLSWDGIDKLLLYAILLMSVQILVRFIYSFYCQKHFIEAKFNKKFDKSILKEMLSFAGWNFFGGMAQMLYTQGLNILLNVFFGPVVNAARGIAVQVQYAVTQFAQSFQMAVNPQITKTYAKGQLKDMHKLIFYSSKLTFLLLFILSFPIFVETKFILELWLHVVPNWTVPFLRIMLCIVVVDSVANPFMTAVAATGKVKLYQSIIGGIQLLIVPIAYIVLRMGGNPSMVFITHLSISIINFMIRLFIVRALIKIKIADYFKKCILKMLYVLLPSVLIIYLETTILADDVAGIAMFNIVFSFVIAALFAYYFGLSYNERLMVVEKIVHKFKQKNK